MGTSRELTSNSGDIAWEAVYQAWGNTVTVEWQEVGLQSTELNAIEKSFLLQPHRFQGQIYDNETGLHYNRFRYYDPDAGRFISHDPIGLLGGDNQFQYAPNPVEWVDPNGLARLSISEGIAKAQQALQNEIDAVSKLSNSQKSKITTMVGATDLSTGKTTVAKKIPSKDTVGKCAEDLAVEQLGADPKDVVFTEAFRPRQQVMVPVCTRCQTKYNPSQFPIGTKFD